MTKLLMKIHENLNLSVRKSIILCLCECVRYFSGSHLIHLNDRDKRSEDASARMYKSHTR